MISVTVVMEMLRRKPGYSSAIIHDRFCIYLDGREIGSTLVDRDSLVSRHAIRVIMGDDFILD